MRKFGINLIFLLFSAIATLATKATQLKTLVVYHGETASAVQALR